MNGLTQMGRPRRQCRGLLHMLVKIAAVVEVSNVVIAAHRAAVHLPELAQLDAKLDSDAPEDSVADIAPRARETSCSNSLVIEEEGNRIVLAARDFLKPKLEQETLAETALLDGHTVVLS